MMTDSQARVCERLGVHPVPPEAGERVGISPNVLTDLKPLNALRHPPENGTCGWYIWAGEEPGSDPDFFVPLHADHVVEWCPLLEPYLSLPPGFRVLVAPGYEDVWFDEDLPTID
jgi:hypothetical protein